MRSLLLRAWSAFPRTPLRPIGGYIPCRQRSTTASCRARRPTKTTGKPFPQELREQLLALASNPSEANKFALKNAQRWRDVKGAALNLRLESFGIPYKAVRGLVDSFLNEVKANRVAFDVDRLLTYGQEEDSLVFFDIFYTSTFWSWACDPLNQATVLPILSRGASGLPTLNHMRRLLEAVSPGNPADAYPSARKMKRKFIMHVGPTNSGKTYHALRALASVGLSNQEHGPGSSAVGAYAGPLRLLAHEIWERLNLGLIKPLGVEEDGDNKPNPLYARPCNMVTGEEVKTVPPSPETGSVPLTALTLEMLPPTTLHSIVVIDEIQLLSDPERGWAWTQAVLGVRAEEVHLCGEESAVPLVRALLLGTSAPSPSPEDIHVVEQNGRMVEVGPVESSIQGTGDTLQVRKYARLTPLIVEKKSLNEQGGLKSVKAGDAIVTFSRSRVWAVKQLLEEALKDTESPQKCALVYGRLPSPVRSSQADLFNDPNSGFGVLVGSDAIGMGLNLKINRVIFDAVSKYDGGRLQKLSVSQVKQIGGRAGRYGMVQSQPASSTGSPPVSGAGYVTCMDPDGLPHIEQCIAAPFANLKSARIAPTREDLARVSEVLGSNSTEEGKGPGLGVVWSACVFIGSARLPKPYRYLELGQISLVASNVDPLIRGLSPDDMWLMSFAPMPWRMATPPAHARRISPVVPATRIWLENMLKQFSQNYRVSLEECDRGSNFMRNLKTVEAAKLQEQSNTKGSSIIVKKSQLEFLEAQHNLLSVYCWMGFRKPVAFSESTTARELLQRVERAMHWGMQKATSQAVANLPADVDELRYMFNKLDIPSSARSQDSPRSPKFLYEQRHTKARPQTLDNAVKSTQEYGKRRG